MWNRCLVMVLLVLVPLGVQATVQTTEILVAAAASLTNAFREIAASYEAGHPQDRVIFSFAASDILQRQIVNGAPVDIFASADAVAMDKAEQAGFIEQGSRRDFARNSLVLIVPIEDGRTVSVADLSGPDTRRIALGNPASVPAGRYAKAALQKVDQWDALSDRFILGQNVRQVLDYVVRGEVDAGFVFGTDAALVADRVRVVQTLALPQEILYPIALVARQGRSPQAAALLDYIRSSAGRAVLERHGFGAP